jgi:hypothetical protein
MPEGAPAAAAALLRVGPDYLDGKHRPYQSLCLAFRGDQAKAQHIELQAVTAKQTSHSRESGNPEVWSGAPKTIEIPAFAGMTLLVR